MQIQTREPIKNNAQNLSKYCQMNGACLDGNKMDAKFYSFIDFLMKM